MRFKIPHFPRRSHPSAIWSRLRSACQPYIVRLQESVAPYWRQTAEWYEKREPREKLLLRLLAGVLGVIFIYDLVYLPARAWSDDLAEKVVARQGELVRIRGMMRSYERLRTELASTQKRTVPGGKDPALFSVLEMTLTSSVGRAKIGSITPTERQVPGGYEQYTVDVKLNEIGLRQIVDTLYSLQ